MANRKHLAILKQGVEVWNRWRQDHPRIRPNLFQADLVQVSLGEADLRQAFLVSANLGGADLSKADLRGANLGNAYLMAAKLVGAKLHQANLRGADLWGADLTEAKLGEADLERAYLNFSKLERTNLEQASVGLTSFGYVDLSQVEGLETVYHRFPSTIGLDTISRSQGKIPLTFLRGAGVPENFIEYMHSLTGKAFEYYSCFISYSSHDQAFAEHLYADLQSKGVRCWFAPEDLKIGAKIRSSIDEAIRYHEKLLLVLSRTSVASQWVEQEVEKALERERKEKRLVLFPVRLDKTVMDVEDGWPAYIRNTRNIGDFTHWKDHDAYQKAFERLLRDLKADL